MEYESRRCLPYGFSHPSYYSPQTLSHTTRANAHGYQMGGPVGGMHAQVNVGREEFGMESGTARRRIAIAVRLPVINRCTSILSEPAVTKCSATRHSASLLSDHH
jgi:hypothetical protein